MNNLARMQTDQFKIEQMVKEHEDQRAYKQWLQALRNQKNRAKFDADFPLPESRARSRRARSRRARSNSMTRSKTRSKTRSNRHSAGY
jgi:hypothetical protein